MIHVAEALAMAILVVMLVAANRRMAKIARQNERLQTLRELSELLQLCTSVNEAIELVPKFGRRLFGDLHGSVYIVRSSPGTLELAAWWPGTGSERQFLTFPMLAAGESMGVMTLSGVTGDMDRQCAQYFTDQVGLTLARMRMLEALHARAVRDPLTGLFNRRYMEETLLRELLRGERAATHIGLIVADVDHFKRFNDTWGHASGDALLRQLARAIERACTERDVICRIGGEEFVVIVPDTSPDALSMRAMRLRDEVRQMSVQVDGRTLGSVTVSVGTAVSPLHGTTIEALFASADRALYAAKRAGRDRVCAPQSEIAGRDAA